MRRTFKKIGRYFAISLTVLFLFVTFYWIVDSATGYGYKQTYELVIKKAENAPNRLILHLPGYSGNKWATLALADHLAKQGRVIGFPYPEGRFVPEKLFGTMQQTLHTEQMAVDSPTEVWILAQSMGAKVFRDFVAWLKEHDPQLLSWLKNVKLKLVLESAPACEEDIKQPVVLLRLVETLDWLGFRGGWLTTNLALRHMQKNALKDYPTPNGVDPAIVHGGQDAFVHFTVPAMLSQVAFLSRYTLADGVETTLLQQLVDDVIFVSGQGPEDDPIIRISQAIGHWREVFPSLRVFTVSEWGKGVHSPNTELPGEYAAVVVGQFA